MGKGSDISLGIGDLDDIVIVVMLEGCYVFVGIDDICKASNLIMDILGDVA